VRLISDFVSGSPILDMTINTSNKSKNSELAYFLVVVFPSHQM